MGCLHTFHFDLKLSEQSLYDVKRLPNFYKYFVLVWDKHSNLLVQSELNKKSPLCQAIFNYKNLMIKGESIWDKLLYSRGLQLTGINTLMLRFTETKGANNYLALIFFMWKKIFEQMYFPGEGDRISLTRLNLSPSCEGKCLNRVYRYPSQLSVPKVPLRYLLSCNIIA